MIVDDGSKDKTWDIIQEWAKKYPDPEVGGVGIRGLRLKIN